MLQLQYGAVWPFGGLVGLNNATLAGEALMSWNTNNPTDQRAERRAAAARRNFGLANSRRTDTCSNPGSRSRTGIINSCAIDSFQTPFAMGYKMRAQTVLPAVRPDLGLSPLSTAQTSRAGRNDLSIQGGRVPCDRPTGRPFPPGLLRQSWVPCGTSAQDAIQRDARPPATRSPSATTSADARA